MFRPGKTQQLTDRIFMLRTLISNFYLYRVDTDYIAFDCGLSSALSRLAMSKLGVVPGKVKAIFLTHSDFDHKGGLRLFPGATVYLPEAEVPMVTGQKARRFIVYNSKIKHYVPLADGETVAFGNITIQLISAPGHTPGSACYRIGNEAIATGDLLQIKSNGEVIQFSAVQNMDHAANLATLNRLVADGLFSECRYLLTGHSGCGKTGELAFTKLSTESVDQNN